MTDGGGGLVEGEGGLLGYYWGRTMGRNAMVLQWVSEQEKHKCWATQNSKKKLPITTVTNAVSIFVLCAFLHCHCIINFKVG